MRCSLWIVAAVLVCICNGASAQTATAVEYYYAAWDYYFVSAFADEIAVLDGGAFGGVWKRTGQTFPVWTDDSSGALATCRFFSTNFAPKSSHFYTPGAGECAGLKSNPDWQFESISFYLKLPDAAGACPAGTAVLYRLYNQGMGGAPNHRYTTDRGTFLHMQDLGWVFEGNGNTGAFACVPESPAAGIWHGTTKSGNLVDGVVLGDGTYYMIIRKGADGSPVAGLQGSSSAGDGKFTSITARNVPYRGTFAGDAGAISGTYVAGASLQLTAGSGATADTIAATYDATYGVPASRAAVAGSYAGYNTHLFDKLIQGTVKIDATGSVTMVGQCTFSGSVTPHGATGVFDFHLVSFGVCLGGPGNSADGVLMYDSATNRIMGLLPFSENDMVFVNEVRQ